MGHQYYAASEELVIHLVIHSETVSDTPLAIAWKHHLTSHQGIDGTKTHKTRQETNVGFEQ